MLEKNGIISQEQIESITPNQERLNRGAVAIPECFQKIPCNPCSVVCPKGAMLPMKDINELPVVNTDICNGCGICISHCPGLAIFVVDYTYGEKEALVKLPYEFLPRPEVNSFVTATDRSGNAVCRAKVIKVLDTKSQDKTAVISIAVPKELAMIVRNFKIEDYYSDNTYVCRCEELTLGELREYIRKGYTTVDEIKRISRAGMGACAGRTCRQLIMNEIAKMTGEKIQNIKPSTFRPPVVPIKMKLLCEDNDDEE